jgi:fatty-acyl-CoA synthase
MTMTRTNPFETGLDKNEANFVALSPLSFIERSASVYPDRIAVIYGSRRQTWRDTYARCRRLASALRQRGIGAGDTVAVMLPNVPAMFEAHFGVPMTGAVLNTLNTRLDAEAIAFMLQHGEARVLLTDREFSGVIEKALAMMGGPGERTRPTRDRGRGRRRARGKSLGDVSYETFLAHGDPAFVWQLPADEWNAIALNYTSGTTGNPKGVVTHHRGAYLNAVSNVVTGRCRATPVYLWTLPMFHCNGWCFPWTMALQAGPACACASRDGVVFDLIREHRVTHLCAAPIVYGMLISAPEAQRAGIATRSTA